MAVTMRHLGCKWTCGVALLALVVGVWGVAGVRGADPVQDPDQPALIWIRRSRQLSASRSTIGGADGTHALRHHITGSMFDPGRLGRRLRFADAHIRSIAHPAMEQRTRGVHHINGSTVELSGRRLLEAARQRA